MAETKSSRSISLTESQKRKLRDLGGSAWVQRAIEEAYAALPKIARSRPFPPIDHSQPLRFRRFKPVVMKIGDTKAPTVNYVRKAVKKSKPTTKGKKK